MEMCNESGCWKGMLSDTRPMMGPVIGRHRLMPVHQCSPAENEVKDKTGKETAGNFSGKFKFSSTTIL